MISNLLRTEKEQSLQNVHVQVTFLRLSFIPINCEIIILEYGKINPDVLCLKYYSDIHKSN